MTTTTPDQATFTPRGGQSWRDPWPMYAALREYDPVHRVVPDHAPHNDYWVLSRYADISEAARDWETFSSAQGLTIDYGEMERLGLAEENAPLVMLDPPAHSEFRRVVHKGFTPKQIVTIEPAVREFAVERIERLRAQGGGDIVAELFKPLANMVVAHYLGVPDADRFRFNDWADNIVEANATGTQAGAVDAIVELFGYFTELVERRKRDPGDDTVSHLIARGFGSDADSLGRVLGWAFTMIAGGNDTIIGMLGGSAQLLTQDRDQRSLLIEDPGGITAAVEEFLRLTSPVQGLARLTTRDVEIDGVTIPAGRKTLLLYASGNRDPRQYGPDAEQLDVRRKPPAILAFSQGAHHCIGNTAARMQSRVVLEELLARCPNFHVDCDAVEYAEGMYVRRPDTLIFAPEA
ncbi:cytochrome P450 [[Mycobacterium] nativiensis]|uniref:Cytochrome P450 n=1 Tax=[Mycobacterium] nativiensis TaxID=2855503 RepID=A0ABU5Y239_9MYCO|nr:cytochrome P450 [Mycolicibacter sp. MYC340]MEB3034278.1 cytochrome P450 [Mycolicibacter sp. MYC340]